MANTISIYDPRTMLEAVKQMLPVNTFLKSTFFTNTKTFVTENVDVDFYKGRRKMAPFVSPRLPGKIMDRQGFETKTYKAPLIKPMRAITVDDLQQRSMGEHIYAAKSPEERAIELLASDLAELDDAITRREEWMCAQVLFTGKVDMIGEGVNQTLDFSFTNKVALSGTDKWSDPNSDPIQDLKNWRLAVIQKSGITPDMVIMASNVVDVFINHPKVKDVLDNLRIKLGQIEPRVLPNGVTFVGSITSLGLDIYSYDEWYFDEEEQNEKTMVPAGTVAVLSTRAKFSMLYGAVTLMGDNEQFITYEGSRIPYSWTEKNPAQRFIQLNSRPVPVPFEVDSWYVAQVL
ncbi:major capsid protein [Thermaerobacillus caldiproteolyticus]|uniref:major capsid protein n=1 Tax=Thermaerobacillus caldiproteolyticus TaxID=247480 RepID=UPI00188CFA80|nr:major capsid protein [Anoxybacillus caldiproteolyticus]QPA33426.1 major capsid protein [Anoxybacillus caldiproteolyticus]